METRQFRRLYREFLFRMVELDVLSADAQGDLSKLFGQFASLLIFLSILFSIPALGVAALNGAPQVRLVLAWSGEHFLIATTMLVTGLFAVLRWDATYPNRQDVLVLAPLPVRGRTIFLAKIAGVGSSLVVAVATLHLVAGFVWPLCLNSAVPAHRMPRLTTEPARLAADDISISANELGLAAGDGIAVGIVRSGSRRVFALGAAKPDSIFQIGSITKTFTGLLLARMAAQGKVRLDEPVRELLPAGTVGRPLGREITLLDLVTHRSGLPPMPNDRRRPGKPNPGADYRAADLYHWLGNRGVGKPDAVEFRYSNTGFGLLGEALAERAGIPYAELVRAQIAEPLGLRDTGVILSPEQRSRVIPAFDARHRPVAPWELAALAGAGALYSTVGDLLTYLEANLENRLEMAETHKLRGPIGPGMQIGMSWIHDTDSGTYWHNGAISGYTSYAFFNPAGRYAGVVLVNNGLGGMPYADLLARHIRARLAGKPAVSASSVLVPASGGVAGLIRLMAAYWTTMAAAGGFIFCLVLTVQGLAAQLLPRRMFLRVSSWMQLGAFCVLVSVYFLQPIVITPDAVIEAQGQGWLAWSPSFWFLGLFQQLNGSPALSMLAGKAWLGLAAVMGGTALGYGLSYLRTLRQIVEEPDIVPGFRRGNWLPRFGGSFSTAIVQFSLRSFLRSRQHRILLAFFLGVAFAITIFLLRSPGAQRQLFDVPVPEVYGELSPPILAATLMVMGFWIAGVRVAFSIPLEPKARWIFQMIPIGDGMRALAARRRAMLLLSVVPVLIASAGLLFWLWPWRGAAAHLLLLGLVGMTLAELCLLGAQKIPFTCSYLPGKSKFHMTFWLCVLLLVSGVTKLAELEQRVLGEPYFPLVLVILFAIGFAARRRRRVNDVVFEEADAGAIQELGLGR